MATLLNNTKTCCKQTFDAFQSTNTNSHEHLPNMFRQYHMGPSDSLGPFQLSHIQKDKDHECCVCVCVQTGMVGEMELLIRIMCFGMYHQMTNSKLPKCFPFCVSHASGVQTKVLSSTNAINTYNVISKQKFTSMNRVVSMRKKILLCLYSYSIICSS